MMHETDSAAEEGEPPKVLELIRHIRFALLTTFDRDGTFHTRPVQTLGVEEDGKPGSSRMQRVAKRTSSATAGSPHYCRSQLERRYPSPHSYSDLRRSAATADGRIQFV